MDDLSLTINNILSGFLEKANKKTEIQEMIFFTINKDKKEANHI